MNTLKFFSALFALLLAGSTITAIAERKIRQTWTDGNGNEVSEGWVKSHCTGGDFFCANCYQDGEFIAVYTMPSNN